MDQMTGEDESTSGTLRECTSLMRSDLRLVLYPPTSQMEPLPKKRRSRMERAPSAENWPLIRPDGVEMSFSL